MKRLLLIDDDELSRAVLELHLSAAGYEVVEAESGKEALALLRDGAGVSADVILSDLQMPGLHGPELARRIRAVLRGLVPLIAMSGSRPVADRYAGYDAFLLKPFTPEQLAEALEAIARGNAEATPEAVPPADATGISGTSSGETTPVLDEETFAQLASMMNLAQLSEIFGLAMAELRKYTEQMQAAIDEGDAAALRASAHTMKGGFSILGAREMQVLGARLEADRGTAADQAATLREIPLAAERLRRMLTSRGLQV